MNELRLSSSCGIEVKSCTNNTSDWRWTKYTSQIVVTRPRSRFIWCEDSSPAHPTIVLFHSRNIEGEIDATIQNQLTNSISGEVMPKLCSTQSSSYPNLTHHCFTGWNRRREQQCVYSETKNLTQCSYSGAPFLYYRSPIITDAKIVNANHTGSRCRSCYLFTFDNLFTNICYEQNVYTYYRLQEDIYIWGIKYQSHFSMRRYHKMLNGRVALLPIECGTVFRHSFGHYHSFGHLALTHTNVHHSSSNFTQVFK